MRAKNEHAQASGKRGYSAFTRFDLLAVALAWALLASALLSCASQPRRKRSELTCSVNLKIVGLALRTFEADNDGAFPWHLSTNGGGTRELSASGAQTFRHFQILSNELFATRVLVCPEDNREASSAWESIRNRNVSYFVGLDSAEDLPKSLVAGDRNITASSGVVLQYGPSAPFHWIKSVGLHGEKGHVLFSDGHVTELDSLALTEALRRAEMPTNRFSVP
jgi:prepilin-type processing-associated H-X9-DG protein